MDFADNSGQSRLLNPKRSILYAIVICLSEIYFGYTLIYLSAVDFDVIAKIYNIDF
jgi:hypothetical protein